MNRFYANSAGRFLSVDSIDGDFSKPTGLNRYDYLRLDPLNDTDPTGLEGTEGQPNTPSPLDKAPIFGMGVATINATLIIFRVPGILPDDAGVKWVGPPANEPSRPSIDKPVGPPAEGTAADGKGPLQPNANVTSGVGINDKTIPKLGNPITDMCHSAMGSMLENIGSYAVKGAIIGGRFGGAEGAIGGAMIGGAVGAAIGGVQATACYSAGVIKK
jgi:hypothetical protein